ncbi:MAG: class I SAM-dependent methyltransferase [Candidatus Omnitrophica bacterium]|nr:class I SAM-dependent methyltransferase [Candidatus Omnitrophota bacterium]MDD5553089.1 class I SAM-dependent methyltransferase [Candidatus Omnitrophota bacterium]
MSSERISIFLKGFIYNARIDWHRRNLKLLSHCEKILDVGCGKGLFVRLAADKIIGLDYNSGSLKECVRSGCTVIRGDVLSLPFADGSFDGVHCADIIEHFSSLDVRIILSEACRVVKAGGTVVIATPLPSKMFWNDAFHVRPYPHMALFSYFMEGKGAGTQPTQKVLPYNMKFVKLAYRYTQIFQLPLPLYVEENRLKLSTLMRPSVWLFLLANVLSRMGINNIRPEGYVMVLRKGR